MTETRLPGRIEQRSVRWLALLGGIALVGLVAVLAWGSQRYGGVDGLLQRVRMEFAQPVEHPDLVPTPLAAAGEGSALALALLVDTATPTATAATPTATPAPTTAPLLEAASLDSLRVEHEAQRPTSTPTVTPPPTATPAPTDTPVPTPQVAPGAGVVLTGLAHFWQTWNNCGPATLAMNLSYYGSQVKQAEAARFLKPDSDDKNVSPHELVAFVRSQGFHALERVDGTPERLRQFVDAGIPVLIETWLDHDGGMGHYRLVIGYDDSRGEWIVYDSYISDGIDPKGPYPGIRMSYSDLNRLWRAFNRTYVLVYDDARAATAEAIIGEDMNDQAMWEQALALAQAEAQANPQDAFAWFNLGSSLEALGRPADAAVAFDQARVIGLPWRMLWYQFAPFRAYYDAGRYDELVAVADATIATAGNIEETFYWKGKGLQALGDIDGARENFRRAAELNSNYADAAAALAELGQ